MPDPVELYLDAILKIPPSEDILDNYKPLPKQKKTPSLPIPKKDVDEYKSCTPVLTPPQQLQGAKACSELYLIYATINIYNTNKDSLILEESEIQKDSEKIRYLHDQYITTLRKQIQKAAEQDSWQDLKTLASYLFSLSSMVFGMYLLSQGTNETAVSAAKWLIASSVLGLFTQFMKETEGFEKFAAYVLQSEKTKKQAAAIIETSFVLLSLGIGVYSGLGGYYSLDGYRGVSALGNISQNPKLFFTALSSASTVSKCFFQIMDFTATKQTYQYHAQAKTTEIEKTDAENRISIKVQFLEDDVQQHDQIYKITKKAISQYGYYS